jgi:hypothetical protein
VNVLGLLFLWSVVFSFAGFSGATPVALALWVVDLAVVTWVLHRLLIYCEGRGWIYYRSGGGGDGRLSASAEWLNMYDPSRRHLQQAAREGEWKRDEDDDGDDPAPAAYMRRRGARRRSARPS